MSVRSILRGIRHAVGRTVGLLLIPVLVIGPTAADGVDEPDPATVAAQQAAAAEFFDWPTPESIGDLAPGTVLDTREVPVTVGAGESSSLLTLPLTASQIMYRTTDVLGRPSAAVTTVLRPTGVPGRATGRAVMYASYYDSLDPTDSPSRAIAGMPVSDASNIDG